MPWLYKFMIFQYPIAQERTTRMLMGYQGKGGTQLIQMTHLVTPPLAKEGEMLGSASNIFSLIRGNCVQVTENKIEDLCVCKRKLSG